MNAKTVGIPRALLYYRYGPLWNAFFNELGLDVMVSPATDRALLERGRALSSDETCLASKAFMGHVDALMGSCDVVFVPAYASVARRSGFCTKFQSVTDMAANVMHGSQTPIVSLLVENVTDAKGMRRAFVDLGVELGATPPAAARAYKAAAKCQETHDHERAHLHERTLRQVEEERKRFEKAKAANALAPGQERPLAILVAAHPYIDQDPYLSENVLNALTERGCTVLFAHEADHEKAYKKSFEFSDTMPWRINREIVGAILLDLDRVDGIVMVSAFPCGPDSMTDDAIVRCIQGKPVLNLTIDAQSGTAGLETRVESFIDILRYQKKGGYVGA